MQEIEDHHGYINSICFDDDDGQKMYSADSVGTVNIWNVYITDEPDRRGMSCLLWHMCVSSYLCLSVGGWKRFEFEFLLIYIKNVLALIFRCLCCFFLCGGEGGREGRGFFSLLLITCVSGCLFKMLNCFLCSICSRLDFVPLLART